MNKTKKRPLIWWMGIYILPDTALIPTTYQTDAGFHYESTPIAECDYKVKDSFVKTLSASIAAGNPQMVAPSPEQVKKEASPVQARMKGRSWKDVERRSIYFSVECFDSEYQLISWGRAADGTWSDTKTLDLTLPISAGVEGIVTAILSHLEQRSDFAPALQ